MKKTMSASIIILMIFLAVLSPKAQGFVNLSLNLANVPADTASYTFVPISEAIPGWTGYIGTNQVTSVLYDGLYTGGGTLAILNSNSPIPPIPGYVYTAVLQAGSDASGYFSASIAQTAVIPATAQSILFTANPPLTEYTAGWQVTINGQIIPVTQISAAGGDYGVYEGNVSAFAGQDARLEFTALAGSGESVNLYLDGISFSSVPEPGGLALTTLGATLFGLRFWRKSSK